MAALVENMMYTRTVPWHGLGTRVDEAPTSADALRLAGLDWTVEQKNIQLCGGSKVPGYKANVRSTDGKVLGVGPLPIAGLMNDKPAEEMSELVEALEAAWAQIGCSMPSPFMTMALIPLACLPELRLTNRGLVDCRTFQFVPLEVEK